MRVFKNQWRGSGLANTSALAAGELSSFPIESHVFLENSQDANPTPLLKQDKLAAHCKVAKLYLKDERHRMGLGSFKALGAAYAIAKLASQKTRENPATELHKVLKVTTFTCASAGNHGLSLAAGAANYNANAVVFVSQTVPEAFVKRLEALGARVERAGEIYEESMAEAEKQAQANGWFLLSDSTWPGMSEPGRDVMEGYLILGEEIEAQIPEPPTHVFLQAGVGGMAAACALSARKSWGQDVKIVVVEPENAPALQASIEAGRPVHAPGPVSNMGRLDCKEPSHLALKYLAKETDFFATITDEEALEAVSFLSKCNLSTTPSGGAGFACLFHAANHERSLQLGPSSRVLCYLSEGSEVG